MTGSQQSERAARERQFFDRGERLRRERLQSDARRPGGELLEQAMRLSAFATELRAGAQRRRG